MPETFRKAVPSDLDQIYFMGIDVWADGASDTDYLEACRASPKYKRGTWYVLEKDSNLLSSLIVYQHNAKQFGIGSIATPKLLRKKGYASKLILKVINELEQKAKEVTIFLYSDISPEFYEKFGFYRLPSEFQRYKTTICMARGSIGQNIVTDKSATPEYF